MAVATALVSALFYAAASVLQHQTAEAAPDHSSMRPRLLVMLATRPLWVAGIAADLAAYGFLFVALRHGSVALVQPLLVTGLLFALPISAVVTRRSFTARDWLGSFALVAGLSVFLAAGAPGPGRDTASAWSWGFATIAVVVPATGIILAVSGRGRAWRAAGLAAAGGAVMGMASALTKSVAGLVGRGPVTVVTSWETYALLACAGVALLVAQSAFQAGPLGWSLPTLTVTETLAGVLLGALLFGESMSHSGPAIAAQVAGMAVLTAGVFALGASPVEPRAGARFQGRVPGRHSEFPGGPARIHGARLQAHRSRSRSGPGD